MSLVEKIRKARQKTVDVGGFRFVVRRPTDLEMIGLSERLRRQDMGALLGYVLGWEGVKELDIIPGGDPHPLAFDAEVCAEWLADRPDLLDAIAKEVLDTYQAHAEALRGAEKNS